MKREELELKKRNLLKEFKKEYVIIIITGVSRFQIWKQLAIIGCYSVTVTVDLSSRVTFCICSLEAVRQELTFTYFA